MLRNDTLYCLASCNNQEQLSHTQLDSFFQALRQSLARGITCSSIVFEASHLNQAGGCSPHVIPAQHLNKLKPKSAVQPSNILLRPWQGKGSVYPLLKQGSKLSDWRILLLIHNKLPSICALWQFSADHFSLLSANTGAMNGSKLHNS